ncbi:putative neutral and basic amino acid transport protein rBAT [Apostichopus japonicus]|uniref:Putative neutral and basic amino acid transport protein rBAT n=1 Tax=Stichopus japonicus TaxID=307972 RepID=A0A2G8JWP8_STIJA|nr:putative neutral and basic amino acid transport protein rBAT [Apostichopus japonicus]
MTDNPGFDSDGETKFDEVELGKVSPVKNEKALEVAEEHDGPYAGMRKEDVLKYSSTPSGVVFVGPADSCCYSVGWPSSGPRSVLSLLAPGVYHGGRPRSFTRYIQGPSWTPMVPLMALEISLELPHITYTWYTCITEKMDYIKDLGVGAILLNSIYKSPDRDFGYDVSDLKDVNENFGSIDDFEALLNAAHERDLKVILDFVPNQASLESEMFKDSQLGSGSETENDLNSYVWSDEVPNNWASITYQNLLKELFLFLPYYFQLQDSMEKWFAMGVDGLNIQGTQFLFEGPIHKDEPVNDNYNGEAEGYDSLLHYYTSDYTGVHELLNTWREGIFFRYSTAGTYRLMITDSDTNSTYLGNYYGTDDNPEADLAKNYNLLNIGDVNGDGGRTSGTEIDELLRDWLNALPDGEWPSFQLGSHNARRIASRLSHPYVKVANMLLLTLPGTPICYYGDEIGMKDTMIETYDDVQDIKGKNDQVNWAVKTRDPERGPMQWNDSANAGFSKSEPWLPVADNYNVVNVERQLDQEFSTLGVFKKTVAFRSDNRAFLSTDIQMLEHENDITAYIRSSDEQSERFLVVLSFSDEHMYSDLFNKNNDLPLEGTVRVATDDDREGKAVQLNKLSIFGGEGLIIELH